MIFPHDEEPFMRPLAKEGDHDHEVDEVAWADRADALGRLRYESDRRLISTMLP